MERKSTKRTFCYNIKGRTYAAPVYVDYTDDGTVYFKKDFADNLVTNYECFENEIEFWYNEKEKKIPFKIKGLHNIKNFKIKLRKEYTFNYAINGNEKHKKNFRLRVVYLDEDPYELVTLYLCKDLCISIFKDMKPKENLISYNVYVKGKKFNPDKRLPYFENINVAIGSQQDFLAMLTKERVW